MTRRILSWMVAGAAAAALAACQQGGGAGNQTAAAVENEAEAAAPAGPPQPVMVGGAMMDPAKPIAENAAQSGDHGSFVAALKAAGLTETLAGPTPYTVFAPTNAAFGKLPAGAAEGLMKPDQKARLTAVLTTHLVPGVVTTADLGRAIERGGGKAQLATVGGGTLTVARQGDAVVVTDAAGGQARVTQADVMQSNGVLHVVDGVLMPKS